MKLNIYLTLSFRVNVVANAKKWTRNEKMNPKKVRNSKCQISERPSSQKKVWKGQKTIKIVQFNLNSACYHWVFVTWLSWISRLLTQINSDYTVTSSDVTSHSQILSLTQSEVHSSQGISKISHSNIIPDPIDGRFELKILTAWLTTYNKGQPHLFNFATR